MPYLTNADVVAYLGETLSAPQEAQVDALIPAVEVAANAYTNRQWGVTTTQIEGFDGEHQVYFASIVPGSSVDDRSFVLYGSDDAMSAGY